MNTIHHLDPETKAQPYTLNKIHKFFVFSHKAMTGPPWINRFKGWYVHDHSWEEGWIVISMLPSPRRIGEGPGTWLYRILPARKSCNCKKMADLYDMGVVQKNTVAKHFTKQTYVPYLFTWSFVACVEKLWQLYHAPTNRS